MSTVVIAADQERGALSPIDYVNLHPARQDSVAEILEGLNRKQKVVSPKYFYDQVGSELFEEITAQQEYYPTRTERWVLSHYADEIARYAGPDCLLIEPGCGSCEKVRLLLDALKPSAYIAMDISDDFLLSSARSLAADYPELAVQAVCADFSQLASVQVADSPARRVAFFPGSTLGNFDPDLAQAFLRAIRQMVGPNGALLIGVDRHKDSAVLNAAYNDRAGVTARFNRNVLTHLNRILPADFDLSGFEHHAFYNEGHQRIEMHLRSLRAQQAMCAGRPISFRPDETIHSENSYKYSPAKFTSLAASAGFDVPVHWSDPDDLFSVYFCEAR